MEYCKIKDIAVYQKKSKIKAGEGKEKGLYPFFTSSSILSKYIDKYIFDGEYLIFGTGGSASINYYNGKFATSTDNFIIKINDEINTKYIYYYLINNIYLIEKGFKGAGLKHLSKEHLDNISIPVPERSVQDKIVKVQDSINEQKRYYELEKAELDELINSKFGELFNNSENVNKMTLKDCSNFIDYRGGTPKVSTDGEIRMINAKSVGKGYFKYIPEFVTEKLYNEWMHRGFAYPGDILFVTEGATFGNVCLIPSELKKFALGQRVITIQGKKDCVNNNYLFCYMQTSMFRQSINFFMTGGTAKGIKSKDLSKIEIPIPSIEKQNEFSLLFNKIDNIKKNIDSCVTELVTLQSSFFAKEINNCS